MTTGKTKRWVTGLVVVLGVLLAARAALPYLAEWWIDRALQSLPGYTGDVEDVDLALYRGGAVLRGIRIVKTDASVPVPFVEVEEIDGSIDWSALDDGAIVLAATVRRPEINFVEGPTEATSQYGRGVDWHEEILELLPLDLNRVLVVDGEVHYRNFHADPPINMYVQNLSASLTNLANVREVKDDLPGRLEAEGLVLASGALNLDAKVDLLARAPTFDMDIKLRSLKLEQLNPLLRAQFAIDAQDGTLALYSQVHGHDQRIEGYAKPILEGVDLHEAGESGDFFDRAGDAMAGAAMEILENQPKDRIATRVPIEGTLLEVETDLWVAAFGVIRNAYIRAFSHGLQLNGPTSND